MQNAVSSWIGPPVFPGDPDRTRVARIIHGIVAAVVGVQLLAAVVPIYPGDFGRRLWLAAMVTVAGGLALFTLQRRSFRTAALVLTGGLWLVVTTISLMGHGVRGEGYAVSVVVVMVATFLMGSNWGLAVVGLCSGSGLAMALLETTGRWTPASSIVAPIQAWFIHSLIFVVCWVTVRLSTTPVGEAMKRARTELDERRITESALHRAQSLSSRIVETSPVGIAVFDREGQVIAANRYADQLMGPAIPATAGPGESATWRISDLAGGSISDDDLPFQRVRRRGLPVHGIQQALTRPDGRQATLSINAAPLWTEDGQFDGMVAAIEDITERSRAEQALQESEERFRRLAEATLEGIAVSDHDRLIDANLVLAQMFGFEREADVIGRRLSEFIPPDSDEIVVDRPRSLGEDPLPRHALRQDGTLFPVEVRTRTIPFQGRLVQVSAVRDVTERQRTDELLLTIAGGVAAQTGERFFRSLVEHLASGLEVDFAFVAQFVDDHTRLRTIAVYADGAEGPDFEYALAGTPCSTIVGHSMLVYPRSVQRLFPQDADLARRGVEAYAGVPLFHGDGSAAGLLVVMHRRPFRSVVQLQSILKIFAVRAAAELERTRTLHQREALEDRLRQAQKMETIGQLAGGVAHDFNNLLSPILGFSEMALEGLPLDDPRFRQLTFIREAAEKAATLTRQLLSFSRKQVLETRPIDLNRVVAEFQRILRRTIREDIDIEVDLAARRAVVQGDVSQVEQIIMNLASNAQDALPEGGHLRVSTSDVTVGPDTSDAPDGVAPGAYVVLEVSDDGAGMDAETVRRIFEPFFTTKEKGRGTGLGLATVYGIASQHRGGITVVSAPGHGTSFRVYLPSGVESCEPASIDLPAVSERGSETILVVEDDAMVRTLTCAILRQRGYAVLEMDGPDSCLRHVAGHGCTAQLLVTDVVMPGMNGKQLYDQLAEQFPALKVVFISGYAHDVIAGRGVIGDALQIVQKPFTAAGLAGRVREVLDS